MSRLRALPACLLLAALLSAAPAMARVWTIAAPRGPVVAVAAQADDGFLALARERGATAVLRIAPSGDVIRLGRLARACSGIAAAGAGGALVACGDADLLQVAPTGQVVPLAVSYPVRYVDGLAATADGTLAAVTMKDGDHAVLRIGPDGMARQVLSAAGEIRALAAAGPTVVFAEEDSDGAVLIRRADADGTVTTLAGGGRPAISGVAADVNLAALAGGDVLLAASFGSVERLVRIAAKTGTSRVLATPAYRDRFNFGDGAPLARAAPHVLAIAAGANGDVAIADAIHGGLRWLDAPGARRLAVAITATRGVDPAISVRATERARMAITVRRHGRTVWRGTVRGRGGTRRVGALVAGRYTVSVTASGAHGRHAHDAVPLVIGRNPTTGQDCTRVSAVRVDCLHPEASLNDVDFGYVVMLRRDGQLWQANVDPRRKPGAPIPKEATWNWLS